MIVRTGNPHTHNIFGFFIYLPDLLCNKKTMFFITNNNGGIYYRCFAGLCFTILQ